MNNRPQGSLPSTTEINPKGDGNEHYKLITLRSGKKLSNIIKKPKSTERPLVDESTVDEKQ